MEITPQDVQQKQFDQVKRGFDPQQVGIYLDQMAAALASRDRELHEARTEIEALGRAVADVKQNEEAFRLTMTAATQAKEEMLRRASEEAAKIEEDARAAAALLTERSRFDAEDQIASAKREVEVLQAERARLESQLEQLRDPNSEELPLVDQGAGNRPSLELVADHAQGVAMPDAAALSARVGDLRG